MRNFLKIFHSFLLLCVSTVAAQSVLINEVMPINKTVVADEDGDYPDWLELYNPNSSAVDVGGYALSDDRTEPTKWRMPTLSLSPNEHLLIFASDKDRNELIYWNTIINQGDEWSYFVGDTEPPSNWNTLDFNASSWQTGPSGFGYGDGDDATILANHLCVYVRKVFRIQNSEDIRRILLSVDYDDAFVAYLNGHEIARANVGSPREFTSHDTHASGSHEALMIHGAPPEDFYVDNLSLLHSGDNVLALQVHNVNATSSDMTLIPFLTLGSAGAWQNPVTPPPVLELPETQLHTNFKIKGAGETLYLTNADGDFIDSVRTPSLPADISYERYPDGSDAWQACDAPTPSEPNKPDEFAAFASSPEITPNAVCSFKI